MLWVETLFASSLIITLWCQLLAPPRSPTSTQCNTQWIAKAHYESVWELDGNKQVEEVRLTRAWTGGGWGVQRGSAVIRDRTGDHCVRSDVETHRGWPVAEGAQRDE